MIRVADSQREPHIEWCELRRELRVENLRVQVWHDGNDWWLAVDEIDGGSTRMRFERHIARRFHLRDPA